MTETNGSAANGATPNGAADTQHAETPTDATSTANDSPSTQAASEAADVPTLQAQIDALNDQLLRAYAEQENIRRRAQDDVTRARKFGIESFAESLVPVKDSLEAALAQSEQTLETLREGVETTLRQLTSAFERNQLKAIEPAVGDKFDPHCHQAISSVPSDVPANTVAQMLQKGYLIAERVLRPALVMVSAGSAPADNQTEA